MSPYFALHLTKMQAPCEWGHYLCSLEQAQYLVQSWHIINISWMNKIKKNMSHVNELSDTIWLLTWVTGWRWAPLLHRQWPGMEAPSVSFQDPLTLLRVLVTSTCNFHSEPMATLPRGHGLSCQPQFWNHKMLVGCCLLAMSELYFIAWIQNSSICPSA